MKFRIMSTDRHERLVFDIKPMSLDVSGDGRITNRVALKVNDVNLIKWDGLFDRAEFQDSANPCYMVSRCDDSQDLGESCILWDARLVQFRLYGIHDIVREWVRITNLAAFNLDKGTRYDITDEWFQDFPKAIAVTYQKKVLSSSYRTWDEDKLASSMSIKYHMGIGESWEVTCSGVWMPVLMAIVELLREIQRRAGWYSDKAGKIKPSTVLPWVLNYAKEVKPSYDAAYNTVHDFVTGQQMDDETIRWVMNAPMWKFQKNSLMTIADRTISRSSFNFDSAMATPFQYKIFQPDFAEVWQRENYRLARVADLARFDNVIGEL